VGTRHDADTGACTQLNRWAYLHGIGINDMGAVSGGLGIPVAAEGQSATDAET
jgi:hypothetical protein